MLCGPFPGGACVSFCGVTGTGCDGACVETSRAGELCLKPCASDQDCRAEEGYACDPQWKACAPRGFSAIVPRSCPGSGPAVDARFGPSRPWSSAASAGVHQLEPAAALTDDGGLVAVYIARGAMTEGNALGVARMDGAGAVTLDQRLGSAKRSHFDPWMAADRSGALHAAWYGFDGRDEHGEIALVTSSDRGATWSEPRAVHDPADCPGEAAGCLDKPMIAAGPDPKRKASDVLYVMYSAGEMGLRVRASRDVGKTFGPTVTALPGIYGNAVTTSDGRLHLAANAGSPKAGFGSAKHQIHYTVSADAGASFDKPVTVSGPDEVIPFFFSNASVAVDERRKWTYVAYARGGRDAVWDIVIAASKDGKTWKRTAIGDGCSLHMVPNVALDPVTGTLFVAYYESAGNGRFALATCTPGAAQCTPRGAINSVPFAALSTVRHGSKWIGEYEALAFDAKRRVLHAVWSQPVREDKGVVSRLFHASAKIDAAAP